LKALTFKAPTLPHSSLNIVKTKSKYINVVISADIIMTVVITEVSESCPV